MMNFLYLGDCLDVLREYLKDETVDLIYIDPPFNSKRNYSVFFDDKEIQSQRIAFEDTWSLKNVGDSLQQLRVARHLLLYDLLKVYQQIAPQVFPYLVMMGLRIVELHRVLKPTGSFYLHCDPTASHYLKTVCDAIFGSNQFKNHICWRRATSSSSKSVAKRFGTDHDDVLFYTKSDQFFFNQIYLKYPDDEIKKRFKKQDDHGYYKDAELATYSPETLEKLKQENRLIITKNGKFRYKIYLDEIKGVLVDDVWIDIFPINSQAKERLGYPTQKPKTLLERIIKASSHEGDLVLDAFCGCGTTVDAAEGLNRRWIGVDISPLALSVIKRRLNDTYQGDLCKFEVRGIPTDEASAIKLWEQNAFAFQDWWITEFEAFSSTFGKKGADKGVDGIALYQLPLLESPLRVAFQVKGGDKVQSKDIDALIGAMVKHKCELGVFLTRAEPTKPMLDTVAQMGYYEFNKWSYPKIQILTLAEYFAGKVLKLPKNNVTFKSANTLGKNEEQQDLI